MDIGQQRHLKASVVRLHLISCAKVSETYPLPPRRGLTIVEARVIQLLHVDMHRVHVHSCDQGHHRAVRGIWRNAGG
eukprot:36779-Eustigmatos_ZCMA.PRE.1